MLTELFTVVGKALGIAEPLIGEHSAQQYQNEKLQRIDQYQEILDTKDVDERRARLGPYVGKLCNDSGNAVGRLSGTSIEVPVEYFDILIRNTIDRIKLGKELETAQYVINQAAKK